MKGTLKSRRAFSYIYEHGNRAFGSHVVVFAVPEIDGIDPVSREEPGAVGIVASRKVGNSPRRSRAKRVLRAALRGIRTRQALRGHLILVARRSLIDDELRSTQLEPELEALLRSVGSLSEART